MLSVEDSPELQAAVLRLRRLPRDLRNDINRSTKAELDPLWKDLVQRNAHSRIDTLVLASGARIKAGNPPVALAAQSNRALRGGLVPSQQWAPFEFGGTFNKLTTYQRLSPKGHRHTVKRHTARQLPRRVKSGRVVFPAVADFAPKAASLWVSMCVRKVADALNVGR